MGIYTDFLNATVVLDTSDPIVALDRAAHIEITRLQAGGDLVCPAAFAVANEVQSIAVFADEITAGNYTLTVLLKSAETFTTANIAYNANAATIETAVDVAATGNITSWTNGDITVSGGALTATPVVLTFDGDSVLGKNHSLTTVADVDLTQDTIGTEVETNKGVAPVNEVQSIAVYTGGTVTAGNFTLTILLADTTTVTTANLLFSASAATIETAIDVAATAAAVPSWTNGDITVAGGALTANPVTLTFDGVSVAGANHSLTVINDVDLVGGGAPGAVTETNKGVAPVNEVQTVNVFAGLVNGGNYTLEFTMNDATNVTTANIAYDALAAAIETAIDTAMTGNYTSWTNGDITVALAGNMTANDATLTYDGTSVAALDHGQVVCADVDLAGGGTVNGTVETTPGVTAEDEVQGVAVFADSVTSGNYTLEFTIAAVNFTTANIAYDAAAATIETAIDVAATAGGVAGWTNGDITVSGGAMNSAPVVLTFDGTSVGALDQNAVTVASVDLLGVVDGGTISESTPGVAAEAEVQTIGAFDGVVTSGNYTLEFTIGATNFTTANVLFSANAATIETAIDVAATAGGVAAWTNGDITVSGGPLNDAAVVLTFDGTSVDELDQNTVVIADVDLVADPIPVVSVTTSGQEQRTAWAILYAMGLVTSGMPLQGVTPTGLSLASTPQTNASWPRPGTIRALCEQASIDDDNSAVYTALIALFNIN